MKTRLILIALTVLSFPAFSQLNKTIVESKFPLLDLPYSTKGLLTEIYVFDGAVDPQYHKFIKSDITTLMSGFKNNDMFYIAEESKYYAIGRISNGNQNFILFLEARADRNSGYGIHEIFIVSLNKSYQPVEIKSIAYLEKSTGFDKDSNSIYRTTHIFSDLAILKSKLSITLTDTYVVEVMPGNVKIENESYTEKFHFNSADKLIEETK